MTLPATIGRSWQIGKRDDSFVLEPPAPDIAASFLSVLWRFRGLFIAFAAVIFVVLGDLSFYLPKNYTASSLLAYDVRPMRAVVSAVSQPRSVDDMTSDRVDPSVLASEADIITSRATILRMLTNHPELAEPPVKKGGVHPAPEIVTRIKQWVSSVLSDTAPTPDAKQEEIILRISQHLSAIVPHSSSLIRVSFQAYNPGYAAAVVNAIVAAYLQDQVAAKRGAIHSTIQHLQMRLKELGQQVVAADQAVQDFRSQHNLLKPTVGTPLPNMQQLGDLAVQEGRVQADLASETAMLNSLKEMSPDAVAALQPDSGPGSQMTRTLSSLQGVLQKRLSEREGRYLDSNAEITLLRQQVAKVHEGLTKQGQLVIEHQQSKVDALTQRLAALEHTQALVASDVQSENGLDSQLLRLTAESQSAKASYDAFLSGFTRMAILEDTQVPDVRVVDPAAPPNRPAISQPIILILLAPISVLLAGILVAIRGNRRSGMGLTDRAFERMFGLPVLGVTPRVTIKKDFYRWAAEHPHHALSSNQTIAAYGSAVRGIRTMIDLQMSEEPQSNCRTIAVVSAVSGEGKSGLAVSLAAVWAASGKSVLLIDCDFQRPTLHRVYDGSDDDEGLASCLGGHATLEKAIRSIGPKLDLMPSGRDVSNAVPDLGRPEFSRLLARLGERYDRVLLDLPPVMTGSDAQIGAALADFTLLVSRWDGTPKMLTEGTVDRLRALNLRRMAAVLTRANMKRYFAELGMSSYVYAKKPL